MAEHQFAELLGSEGGRAVLETGGERGWIEPAELEVFALECELVDAEVEGLTVELSGSGLRCASLCRRSRLG